MTDLVARALAFFVAGLVLAACGRSSPANSNTPSAAGIASKPAAPKLARIFDQSCAACHAKPGTAAPQVGDRAAWAPRLAQGDAQLLAHVLEGYKGMPPLGSCGDCSEEDFTALIAFMSRGEGAAAP